MKRRLRDKRSFRLSDKQREILLLLSYGGELVEKRGYIYEAYAHHRGEKIKVPATVLAALKRKRTLKLSSHNFSELYGIEKFWGLDPKWVEENGEQYGIRKLKVKDLSKYKK